MYVHTCTLHTFAVFPAWFKALYFRFYLDVKQNCLKKKVVYKLAVKQDFFFIFFLKKPFILLPFPRLAHPNLFVGL